MTDRAKPKRVRWEGKRDAIVAMVARGLTQRQIGEAFGVSEKAAGLACYRLGISVPRNSAARRADPGACARLVARINRGEVEQFEEYKRSLAARGAVFGANLVDPE